MAREPDFSVDEYGRTVSANEESVRRREWRDAQYVARDIHDARNDRLKAVSRQQSANTKKNRLEGDKNTLERTERQKKQVWEDAKKLVKRLESQKAVTAQVRAAKGQEAKAKREWEQARDKAKAAKTAFETAKQEHKQAGDQVRGFSASIGKWERRVQKLTRGKMKI